MPGVVVVPYPKVKIPEAFENEIQFKLHEVFEHEVQFPNHFCCLEFSLSVGLNRETTETTKTKKTSEQATCDLSMFPGHIVIDAEGPPIGATCRTRSEKSWHY